jgi:hypothetical protein
MCLLCDWPVSAPTGEGATGQVRKWICIGNRLALIVLSSVFHCYTCKIRPFSFYNHTRLSVGKSTECIYSGAFIFVRFNCTATPLLLHIFNCTATPLLLHIFPATTEAGIVKQGEFFYSLLISVFVLYYQPKRQNCFHVIIICNFLVAMVLLQGCKQTLISQRQIPLI